MTRILITGGAGFVGSNLAVSLASRHPDWEIVALDNLYRRGSELNLPRLAEAGVEFVDGDVREPADLQALPALDALLECSAEPSVMSGVDGDTSYLVHTNLTGAYNCLELARRDGAFTVFLSTSRVYPVAPQLQIRLEAAGVEFVRGDVREPGELERLPKLSALVECSAEPSVMSGVDGETSYLLHTNLIGAYNCLELARRDGAQLLFLSTSRV